MADWDEYARTLKTMGGLIRACDQCGDYGAAWRELPREGLGEGVMLCDDCWRDAEDAMRGPDPALVCEFCDRDMCLRGAEPCDCACHTRPNVTSRADH